VRPNVPEIVRGLNASLVTGIMPEIASPWAQAQLRYMLGLLNTVAAEWDGAAENLVRENEALLRLCAGVAGQLRAELSEECLAGLFDVVALPATPNLRLSTLSERNDRLWRAAEPLIEIAAADGTALAADLKERLQPLLRGYVAARQPGGAR
jgi:hypothetical protein